MDRAMRCKKIFPLLEKEGWARQPQADAPGAKREPDRAKRQLSSVRPKHFAERTTPSAPSLRSAQPPLVFKEGKRVLSILIGVACLLLGAQSSRQVEWLYYGGDQAGTKYSPLGDINASNVNRLEVAWQWKHWETQLPE